MKYHQLTIDPIKKGGGLPIKKRKKFAGKRGSKSNFKVLMKKPSKRSKADGSSNL